MKRPPVPEGGWQNCRCPSCLCVLRGVPIPPGVTCPAPSLAELEPFPALGALAIMMRGPERGP